MNRTYTITVAAILCCMIFQPCLYSENFDHSYHRLEEFYKITVVMDGRQSSVKYTLIKEKSQELEVIASAFSSVTADEYKAWTKEQKLAFLINAYNIFTIKLINTKYPGVKSIKDLGSFFSSPWKKKFFRLLGKKTHLDHIEHGLLRKKFKEPRIHFAIVCASESCPPLLPEPYVAEKLEAQLKRATVNFLQDRSRNYYDKTRGTLYLSKLFKWFSEDFEEHSGTVQKYAKLYIENIPDEEVNIEYLDYSWALNDLKK